MKLAVCPFDYFDCAHWKDGYCSHETYKSLAKTHDESVVVEECGLNYEERRRLARV